MNDFIWNKKQTVSSASRIAQLENFFVNRGVSNLEASSKKFRVASKPHLFILETTSVCNLKCVMCPHGNNESPPPEHLLPESLEKVSDFMTSAESIQLTGLGEPLLSPMFWEALTRFTPLTAAKMKVISNGVLLTPERTQKILTSGLRQISFSVDSCKPETYARIRGAQLEKVLGNISSLITARNDSRSTQLLIELNMTVMKENVDELEEYIDFAVNLGVDKVCFQFLNEGYSNGDTSRWEVKKGDWVYKYSEQSIQNFPELFKVKLE
ncbi:MAG: radical SAM protein, partial [Bdellovibrionaceae bacterium]|nr:radical SAM protein [Pseudobdellovibrionaceae bacterium]